MYVISGPLFLAEDSSTAPGSVNDSVNGSVASTATTDVKPQGTREGPTGTKRPRDPKGSTREGAGKAERHVRYRQVGEHDLAVPTHLFKVVLAENKETGKRAISAFVMANGPLRGHPELDAFVVPLATLESQAELQILPIISRAY